MTKILYDRLKLMIYKARKPVLKIHILVNNLLRIHRLLFTTKEEELYLPRDFYHFLRL